MAEIDDLRLQLDVLKAQIGSAQERLAEQEKINEALTERIAQLYRLSVPAAAGTHLALGEMATIASASGQQTNRHDILINAIAKAISELRDSAKQ